MSIGVSDHALLRFLELGGALDVERLRSNLNESLARAHAAARAVSESDYLIKADGLIFLVRGDTVVTVLDDKEPGGRAYTLANRPGGAAG